MQKPPRPASPKPGSDRAPQDHLRRQLLKSSESVPPLPDVVTRLVAILDDPSTSPAEIEAVLTCEPVLVGKILGLVNSSLFSMSRQFESVAHAVVMIGRSALRNMVLAHAASPFMVADFGCYGYAEKGLWRHSVAVAAAAGALCQHLEVDRDTRELVFLAGLMHDVGKMLIAPHLNLKRMTAARMHGNVIQMERQTTGIEHAEAGALVASKWQMPDTVAALIREHHEPNTDTSNRKQASLAAVLRLAEAHCHEGGLGYAPGLAPEAHYRADDHVMLGPKAIGVAFCHARDSMTVAVDQAIAAFDRLL